MRQRIRLDIVAGMVILVDVLRIYLPSLITIFGQAGETPAELMGGYAVVWFGLAFAAVPMLRRLPSDVLAKAALAVLLVARLSLQFTDGGDPQLYLATAGVLAGLVWLIATAAGASDAPGAATSALAGMAAGTAIHAALDGVDLIWRPGIAAGFLLAGELAVAAVAGWRHRTPTAPTESTARWWWLLGPALVLWGMFAGNPGYATASDGLPGWLSSAVVAAAGAGSVVLVARPGLLGRHRAVPAGLVLVSAVGFAVAPSTVEGIAGVAPAWTILIPVAGAVGVASCLGWAALSSTMATPARRGYAVAGGMAGYLVGVFAFYSAYDLGLPNRWVPIAVAIVFGIVVLSGRTSPAPVNRLGTRVPAAALAAGLLAAVAPAWQPSAPPVPDDDQLRIAAYNIRMGFGLNGRFDVDAQTETLAAQHPDVIMLSEVDRGWLLNGGHDDLHRIADRLGMRYVWAPAGDELWGDALLTNLPVTRSGNHPLVPGGPTGAQALEVGIDWHGTEVTMIATHTQPPSDWSDLGQAEQLANIAADAATRGPVVLAGDLNTEPGDTAFAALTGGVLHDGLADYRPMYTMLSDPEQQLDQILVTEDLTVSDPARPDVGFSDHRPIAVTITV